MDKIKKNLPMILSGIVILILVIAAIAAVLKPKPPEVIPAIPRPVMRVVVSRACDFVTINKSVTALCVDNTEWAVLETTAYEYNAPAVIESEPEEVVQATPFFVEDPKPVEDKVVVSAEAAPVGIRSQDSDAINMNIRYSHYWPPLGGPNCSNFVNGKCISTMASGHPWATYVDIAVACPPEWAFGTEVIFAGQTWVCMDRGGKIKYVEGIPWIDFLTPVAAHTYGTVITVQVVLK